MADGKKFADVVVARIKARPAAKPDDEEAPPDSDGPPLADTNVDAGDMDDQEAAEQGKVLRAAIQAKDDVAIREAVKAIVHECLEEYGVGK